MTIIQHGIYLYFCVGLDMLWRFHLGQPSMKALCGLKLMPQILLSKEEGEFVEFVLCVLHITCACTLLILSLRLADR